MSHTTTTHDIIRALNRLPNVRFWKNPVGHGYADSGNRIQFGLAVGSSDLIGLVDGRFVALEVKTGSGRERPEQVAFRTVILKLGGHAAVVRSVEDAVSVVESLRKKAA